MSWIIRSFTRFDIPEVARLRRQSFRLNKQPSIEALERYIDRIFFHNPWCDPELPSYVLDIDGEVRGFAGVLPRRVRVGEERYRAIVTTQIMVAPANRGVAGTRLLQTVLNGPQDLAFADLATQRVVRLWTGLGGGLNAAYGFRWARPLRISRHARRVRDMSLAGGPSRRAVRTAARTVDRLALHTRFHPMHSAASEGTRTDPDPATFARQMSFLAGPRTLHVENRAEELEWLLDRTREKWETLDGAVVRAPDGSVIGGYLFYIGPDGVAQVLQLTASENHGELVWSHLLEHAWGAGAVAATGRVEPSQMALLTNGGCRFEWKNAGLLIHSRTPKLLHAVLGGRALFGGLDGEWWLNF